MEREERKRIKRERQERRERENLEVKQKQETQNKRVRGVLLTLLFFAYISTCSHLSNFIVALLGNNILGWIACGCVGLAVSVGFVMIGMLVQGRKL